MQSWFICPIISLQVSFMVLTSSSLQRSTTIMSMRKYSSNWHTSDVYHYPSIIFPWAGTAEAMKTSENCFLPVHTFLCSSYLVIEAHQSLVFCIQAWCWHDQESCEDMPAGNNAGGIDNLCCEV